MLVSMVLPSGSKPGNVFASNPVAFPRLPLGVRYRDPARASQAPVSLETLHFVLLEKELDALHEFGDYLGFAGLDRRPVNGEFLADDSVFLGILEIVVDLCVQ